MFEFLQNSVDIYSTFALLVQSINNSMLFISGRAFLISGMILHHGWSKQSFDKQKQKTKKKPDFKHIGLSFSNTKSIRILHPSTCKLHNV